VISERILRDGDYPFGWTIVRPTNIWGPWHRRYPSEFWKVLREGKYFHPGSQPVIRSYGYVGNVCDQIREIVRRREDPAINRATFYLGDRPLSLLEWVNEFSLAITRKRVRVVPRAAVFALALLGSFLARAGITFPITLSRFRSMTSDNPAPMDKTMRILGESRIGMKEGVRRTAEWLRSYWAETQRVSAK
jgi:nucleoside-diphosphate-sugar epimerase